MLIITYFYSADENGAALLPEVSLVQVKETPILEMAQKKDIS